MHLLAAISATLAITIWPQGQPGPAVQRQVTCPGAAVCAQLARAGRRAFAPVPPQTACAQVYGGPQEARVVGRLGGKPLRARFSRTDACQTARWQRLGFLFRT